MAVGTAISKRRLLDLDPDYTDGHIIETKRRCLAEETGQQHVVELVGHELDSALTQKECEALQLQEQVQTCQRLLHVLRYGITSAYYKDAFTETSPCVPVSALDGRSNIHPAVMRLLGVTTSSVYGPKTRATCGKPLVEDSLDQEIQQDSTSDADGTEGTSLMCSDSDSTIITKVKEERKIEDEEKVDKEEREFSEKEKEKVEDSLHLKIPRYVPPNMPEPPTVYATSVRVERHRIKRRLVVGNISKWLPEDVREGAASHKWMMYVRGPKDTPDISDIVSKVRYFLHPSYRPHDIADMSYPFYLARRGWGEFPVRVQVHFSMPGNRPIDIIHNLKLDRSYSGLQTLGGETVVDVWLKNMNVDSGMEEYKVESNQQELGTEFTSVMSTTIFSDGYHETVAHVKAKPVALDLKESTLALGKVKHSKHQLEDRTNDLEKVWETEKTCKEEVHKKEFASFTVKDFVHHTLPDHDYLGPDTFRLKCFSCQGPQCSDVIGSVASDAKVMHQSNDMKVSLSNSLQSSYNLKKPDYETQGLLQNVRNSTDDIGISVKLEESTNKERTRCEFRKRAPASRNGFPPCTSLVQCVDTKGNVFCITLQKPSTGNCGLLKDVSIKSENSSDTLCNKYSNAVDCDYKAEILGTSKNVQKKVQDAPVAPITVGRSLLKRNCLAVSSSSPVPSDTSNVQNLGIVRRNVALGKLHARSLKVNPAPEPAVQLKEAVQLISRMLDDRQVVTWLLQQLPLVNEQADADTELKKQHPYSAPSISTFLSWPLAKRHSAERLRANEAYTILQNASGSRFINWSVRHIMTWARWNALTPVPLKKSHGEQSESKIHADLCSSVNCTVSEPTEVRDWLENVSEASKAAEEMEEVNVEDLTVSNADIRTPNIRDETFKCSLQCMPSNAALCGFVRGTVEQLGICLSPETLCSGVSYPAAEQLLFRACQSLCEDLLRKSMHKAWSRCQQMPNEIKLADVQGALLTRHEFDIFTNAGLGVQAYNAPDDF